MTKEYCPVCDDSFQSIKDKVAIYSAGMCSYCLKERVRKHKTEQNTDKYSRYTTCEKCGHSTMKLVQPCYQCRGNNPYSVVPENNG